MTRPLSDLLGELESADEPSADLVDALFAAGRDAVPGLREIVRKYPTGKEPDWPVEVAVGLLGDLGASEACGDLIALARKCKDDMTLDTASAAVRRMPEVPREDFAQLLRDASGGPGRRVAIEALDGAAQRDPSYGAPFEDLLADHVRDCTGRATSLDADDRNLVSSAVLVLAERHCARHRPVIDAALSAGANDGMANAQTVDDLFRRPVERPGEPTNYRTVYRQLFAATGEKAGDFDRLAHALRQANPHAEPAPARAQAHHHHHHDGHACDHDHSHDHAVQEPVRVDKVGRNDPCPCGSGKKHKKCCGK